jgi:hypothetical protein
VSVGERLKRPEPDADCRATEEEEEEEEDDDDDEEIDLLTIKSVTHSV